MPAFSESPSSSNNLGRSPLRKNRRLHGIIPHCDRKRGVGVVLYQGEGDLVVNYNKPPDEWLEDSNLENRNILKHKKFVLKMRRQRYPDMARLSQHFTGYFFNTFRTSSRVTRIGFFIVLRPQVGPSGSLLYHFHFRN